MTERLFDMRQQIADHYIDWLRNGKPEMGWSGDPMLVLAYANIESRWELWRHEPERNDPDRHVMIAKGPPGAELNDDAINILIKHLIDGDSHRSGNSAEDIMERVIKNNEELSRRQDQEATEATADALDKFYFEAGKTLGVTQTEFFFPDTGE